MQAYAIITNACFYSRIEWVWLHWIEYLKAYEEFELWLMWRKRHLDAEVELQLGLKEKRWQVDQQRVMVNDVHGQAVLLERLIDEAAALHNRTQDPSLDPEALERLQEAYTDVRDRAEVCLDFSVLCNPLVLKRFSSFPTLIFMPHLPSHHPNKNLDKLHYKYTE